jgi:hypothetical protein
MTADAAGYERPATGIVPTDGGSAESPLGEVLRDITRGGLAGIAVGIVLAGIGGRLVMRLAALLVPGAEGALTENGNVVGAITADGTAALVLFIGLFFGAVVGSLWVVIRPWLPARTGARALASVPIAIGLGTLGLIDASNSDFLILGRDPRVIASLVVLVGLFGPALVLAERLLERLLPHARPGRKGIVVAYATVAVLGTALTLLATLPLYLGSSLVVTGVALVLVGLLTLASWWRRAHGLAASNREMDVAARGSLVLATVAGLVIAAREIAGALGAA